MPNIDAKYSAIIKLSKFFYFSFNILRNFVYLGQRCADSKILDPRQSADGNHRSVSASAARCFLGSAVSPRVRDLVINKISLYLELL